MSQVIERTRVSIDSAHDGKSHPYPKGRQMSASDYWSNHDRDCIAKQEFYWMCIFWVMKLTTEGDVNRQDVSDAGKQQKWCE